MNREINEISSSNLKNLEIFIENFDKDVKSSLNLFASSSSIQNILTCDKAKNQIEIILRNMDKYYDFKSVDLGTVDGNMFSSYYKSLPKEYDPRIRPWYKNGMNDNGKIGVTNPYPYILDENELIISYTKMIKNYKTGEMIGVADIDVNFKHIEDALSNLYTNKYMSLILVDSDNNIIMEKKGDEIFSINKRGNKIDDILFLDGYNQKIDFEGKKQRLDRITISDSKYGILMITSSEYIGEELNNIIFFVAAVTILLLLFIKYIISRVEPFILKPIDNLISGITLISNGDYSNKIEFEKKVPIEIESIKNGINNMSSNIMIKTNEIIEQKEEITSQYEEINALYEETTAMNESLNDMIIKLRDSNKIIVKSLSNAIEANDPYTKGHCERVKEYSVEIAKAIGYSDVSIQRLEYAAILHDIGKVGIPTELLKKEILLTDDEYEIVKKHSEIGYKILKEVPYLEDVANIVLQHHERFDGKGYPNGKKADNIHGMARILCVADAYDAMTSERPYRKKPFSTVDALNEIKKNSGTQFDPEIVDAFLNVMRKNLQEI